MIPRRRFAYPLAVFVAALLPRIVILALVPAAHAGDMRGWMEASRWLTENGVILSYAHPMQGNGYPPLFLYFLLTAGWVYQHCCSVRFELYTRSLDILLRVIPILADSLIALAVYWTTSRLWSSQKALATGLLYALNPAVLVTVAWESMLGDPLYVLFVLLCLAALLRGQYVWAALWIAIGVMLKPQALAFVPLAFFWIGLHARRRYALLAGLAAAGVCLTSYLPFWINGVGPFSMLATIKLLHLFPYPQARADNVWQLITLGRDPFLDSSQLYDTAGFFAWLSYRDVGLLAFGLLNALVLYWLYRSPSPPKLVASAGLLTLGFFMLSTEMHVNYSFPAFAFLTILAPSNSNSWRLALVLATVAAACNWLIPYGGTLFTVAHILNSTLYLSAFSLFAAAMTRVTGAFLRPELLAPFCPPIPTLMRGLAHDLQRHRCTIKHA